MGIALVEGGGTGAAGFWGLPANLALSMFIYFCVVQSVAMFYGYDVKDGPTGELDIASEVFQGALAIARRQCGFFWLGGGSRAGKKGS